MATARFFTYKGNLACEINPQGRFINDPFAAGQLGCVIDTAEVGMTAEAKALIKKAHRGDGSFAALMLTKHDPSVDPSMGRSSIALFGGFNVHIGPEVEIGRTCSLEVLDDCTIIEMEAPAGYRSFIDNKE